MTGRYTHAHQFKRARRQLKFLRTRLGRIIRDIRRKIDGDTVLEARFIGHVKAEHRMDRNYLKGRLGDRINAVLAAAGYNFSLLLRWLAELLRIIIEPSSRPSPLETSLEPGAPPVLHERLLSSGHQAF